MLQFHAATVFAVLLLTSPQKSEHPVPLPKDFDASQCASCHEDKTKGKVVHSAVAMGCTTCHEVKTGEPTTITLTTTKDQLCFTCHQISDDKRKHGPYEKGQCLLCHDAHTAEFPKQSRAQVNNLCLACHDRQKSVTIDKDARTVSLPWKQELGLDDYAKAMKIGLDSSRSSGHPVAGHPIEGKNPHDKKNKEAAMNCLSCHVAHSSPNPFLMPARLKGYTDLCAQCH